MKNILKLLSIFLLIPLVFNSCRDEADRDWKTADAAFTLYNTTLSSNVLYPTMENNSFRLSWDNTMGAASYDVVYSTTSDFATKIKLGTSNKNSYTTTIGAINTALLQAGYSPYSLQKVYFRIEVGASASNSISFDVQPYPVDKPVITAPTAESTIVLDSNAPTEIAKTITWNDYSYGIGVKYVVELSLSGANNFKTLGTLDNLKSLDLTNVDLDKALLNAGGTAGVLGSFDVRVSAITKLVNPGITKVSDIVTFKATPYQLASYVYAPGGYQGWNPGTANTLVSATSNGVYVGFINFPSAGTEFKITQNRDWSVNWGDNGADGTLDSGGANIVSPGAGYYKVTVDFNSNTITMVPYQISIIGSATPGGNWSTDVDLAWDDSQLKWTVTADLLAGEFKFRLNHDWGTNWGDDGADGTLDQNGANISISAGSQTLLYDPFQLTYSK